MKELFPIFQNLQIKMIGEGRVSHIKTEINQSSPKKSGKKGPQNLQIKSSFLGDFFIPHLSTFGVPICVKKKIENKAN